VRGSHAVLRIPQFCIDPIPHELLDLRLRENANGLPNELCMGLFHKKIVTPHRFFVCMFSFLRANVQHDCDYFAAIDEDCFYYAKN